MIAWNAGGEDWKNTSAETIAAKLRHSLKPGCIMLMHDWIYKSARARPPYDRDTAIGAVALSLRAAGRSYRFVTVPQPLDQGRPNRVNWK